MPVDFELVAFYQLGDQLVLGFVFRGVTLLRFKIFTNLLFDSLDRITLQARLDAIGKAQPPPSRLPLWPYSQR